MRGLRISSNNDADDGYNPDGHETYNFDKELYELNLVYDKTLVAMVQATL